MEALNGRNDGLSNGHVCFSLYRLSLITKLPPRLTGIAIPVHVVITQTVILGERLICWVFAGKKMLLKRLLSDAHLNMTSKHVARLVLFCYFTYSVVQERNATYQLEINL